MSSFVQEAVELNYGHNCRPVSLRFKLPDKQQGTTAFLLSNSFEYDMELIRNFQSSRSAYKTLVIPYQKRLNIPTKVYQYATDKNSIIRKAQYVQSTKKFNGLHIITNRAKLNPVDNVYVTLSDILDSFNQFLRELNESYVEENIPSLFRSFMNIAGGCTDKNEKILVIDCKRYKLYKKLTADLYRSDLINGLLMYLSTHENIRIPFNTTIVFRGNSADYKLNLDTFDQRRDLAAMKMMLSKIGQQSVLIPSTEEELDVIESYMFTEADTAEDNEVEDEVVGMDNDDLSAEDIKNYQFSSKSPFTSIKATINAIKSTMQQNPTQPKKEANLLNNAKELEINAKLLSKINPATEIVSNYKSISADLQQPGDNPVENQILDNAAKLVSGSMQSSDTDSVLNTVSSPREKDIRSMIGKLKMDAASIDAITSVADVPVPERAIPNNTSTTNTGAMQGSGYPNIARAYEEKVMDRDIVTTFMQLGDLPYGFTVKNIEVTDISTVTTLMNNWKIELDNKKSGRKSVLNIRVPKLINGRFYNNGIWYNISKQDFPIPVLKTDKKTVMITSNYNKMTIERYDTKSLVDVSAFVKIIKSQDHDDGTNPYVVPGSSVSTNSRFASTVEYDEYAKQWLNFNNKSAKCQILFNRNQCAKTFAFVTVTDDEFCCGMINQVPIVLNINTGLTREGKTLTDTMIETLPPELRSEYNRVKPGKLSMYSQVRVLATNMPLGVVICSWEGITTILEKSKAEHQFVDKKFSDSNWFIIPFKDKNLAIKNTIQNQLLFNGFYRISTKAHNYAEFDEPIIESNSIYVDIFNDIFFKKFSDLTAFITTYHFFIDVITKDVCEHFHLPTDITSLMIYASNLLADNSKMNEYNASLYRVRSSEILPAIIHYHLAMAISKYNNTLGSKTRTNTLIMNPNEVVNELLEVNTVSPMSALNPMIEIHDREVISTKGFMGLNVDRSYTRERRSYNPSMIGKVALSSPNSANVGINRQMVADPKLESVRGYTSSTITADDNLNDLQLASFSELLTPGSVSRDDAIRTAMATSQTGHIVSVSDAEPVIIANGVDEIVPSYLTDEFAHVAKEDGKVLEINDQYMIIQYKSGKKEAINIGSKYSFNSGSGFYVDNKLLTSYKVNDSFKKNDILAYHEKYFTKDVDGVVRMNLGPLCKIAFAGSYFTYEDAGTITHKMSERLGTKLTMMELIKIDATDDIDSIVKVGDEVEIGDPLVVFGMGDTGDKSVDNFLKAFQTMSLDTAKRKIIAKHAGKIVDICIYTNKSMDKLSPSLFKIVSEHFKDNKKRREILDKHDSSFSAYKMNTLYSRPTEPLKGNTIKGITCEVLVEIYIEHSDNVSVGDKCVLYGANKQIISEVIPEGLEPYTEYRPDEEISMFGAPVTILKRMVPSVVLTAAGNKVLIEAKRKIKAMWEE